MTRYRTRQTQQLSVAAAWQGQVTRMQQQPWLFQTVLQQGRDIFPRFSQYYQKLSALPRKTRRALKSKFARSLAGAALLLALSPSASPAGTTINVPAGDTTALIDAITAANSEMGSYVGADTIVLETGTFSFSAADNTTYFSGNALPVITSEIVIEGQGSVLERSGGPEFRLIAVGRAGDLTLKESTITGGDVNDAFERGGGLFVAGGQTGTETGGRLALLDSTVTGNTAYTGGGLFNGSGGSSTSTGGNITVTDSTIAGNTAYSGGGLFNRGEPGDTSMDGSITATNATIAGNVAGYGGGLYNRGGAVTLANVTISGNRAGFGGGIRNKASFSSTDGTVTLTRSVVSGNRRSLGAGRAEVDSYGTITADAHNVFGDDGLSNATAFRGFTPSGSDVNATTDGTSTALADILNPLADNGGPTETHALAIGSPALDRVACGLTEDQRGEPRDDGLCDSGAVEGAVPLDPCSGFDAEWWV